MTEQKYRYYYADPIAAAWQVKHHGFQLDCQRGLQKGYWFRELEVRLYDWGDVIDEESSGKMFLTAGDEELLKPQAEDLVYHAGLGQTGLHYVEYGSKIGEVFIECVFMHTLEDFNALGSNNKIIQRNGKAFMWPERKVI